MAIRAYAGHNASADVDECTNTRLQTEIMRLMCWKWKVPFENNDFFPVDVVQEMESKVPKDPKAFHSWLGTINCCGGTGFLLLDMHSEDFHAARRVLSTAAKKSEVIVFL